MTGVELMPGDLPLVLATESKALSAVAMRVTTICFVSRNLIQKAKKKIFVEFLKGGQGTFLNIPP